MSGGGRGPNGVTQGPICGNEMLTLRQENTTCCVFLFLNHFFVGLENSLFLYAKVNLKWPPPTAYFPLGCGRFVP